MPVLVRVSATDWAAGGWDLDQTVNLAKVLKKHGVDLMDVSTGGMIPGVTIPVKPDYQVPFAEQVRSRAEIPTTAVGLITKPKQAKKILKSGAADAIEIGRAALRDPNWPLRARPQARYSDRRCALPAAVCAWRILNATNKPR